jgi:4-hydroxymandelate oxidase
MRVVHPRILADRGPILRAMPDDARPAPAYPPPADPPIGLGDIVSLHDFEAPARARLHPAAWAYYAGGAWDGHTLRANDVAWDRYRLRPRVLVDVSGATLETTILGRPAGLPIGVAPAALHGMAHEDGELATARAAAAAGAINVVSTVASRSLEDVAAAARDARRWFQLYVQEDWALTRRLAERAARAGYEALVLTVDLPVLGYRDDILRLAFDPGADAYANLPRRDAWGRSGALDDVLDMRGVPLTWDTLDEIRSWAPLPLVLKGILTAEDARLAVDHGADAVWVSNHGGRQLDRSPAAIEVLPEVVDAVEGRADVYLDGGVRRGPDVLVALALGATAVFTARPFLYALASAGEAGVATAFAILREEINRALAITGVNSPAALRRDHVTATGR